MLLKNHFSCYVFLKRTFMLLEYGKYLLIKTTILLKIRKALLYPSALISCGFHTLKCGGVRSPHLVIIKRGGIRFQVAEIFNFKYLRLSFI